MHLSLLTVQHPLFSDIKKKCISLCERAVFFPFFLFFCQDTIFACESLYNPSRQYPEYPVCASVVRVYICVCVWERERERKCVCMCVCVCTFLYACIHLCVRVCMCVCAYVFVYVFAFLCVCIQLEKKILCPKYYFLGLGKSPCGVPWQNETVGFDSQRSLSVQLGYYRFHSEHDVTQHQKTNVSKKSATHWSFDLFRKSKGSGISRSDEFIRM